MNHLKKTHIIALIFGLVMLLSGAYPLLAKEKTPFSVEDSLRIKSFSPQSMTDDGRYIAGTIGMRLDRLGSDHKRYGDPTYISSRKAEVVIFDTETKKFTPRV